MIRIVLIMPLIFLSCFLPAQENKTITVNTIKENTEDLTANIFHYPEFLDGQIMYRDNVTVEAKMNYHRLFDQVLFINAKKDTMALANAETYKYVVIDKDTFYYSDNAYLRQITHYKKGNLFIHQTIRQLGNEKEGPYGSFSSVSSSNSNTTYTPDDQITQYIKINQNLLFKYRNEFYLSDNYNNFFKANKKGFGNLYSRQTKELKTYLIENNIDFNKQADLEKLLEYLHSLSQ